jgi:hypothetical protein
LSRKSMTTGFQIRHQATPLTAFAVNVNKSKETFDYNPLRDSTSTQITGSVTFDPFALIKGNATVGYRSFQPSADLPPFQGLTLAVNLSYAVFGTTRFTVGMSRDIQYSYQETQPYYLQTGVQGSIAQQIFGPFDVVARGAYASLAYRDREGLELLRGATIITDRVDTHRSYGVGAGYHMGKDLRLGFNVDHVDRVSPIASRQYSDTLFGSQITYGVP